jgi:hypothetical protein
MGKWLCDEFEVARSFLEHAFMLFFYFAKVGQPIERSPLSTDPLLHIFLTQSSDSLQPMLATSCLARAFI